MQFDYEKANTETFKVKKNDTDTSIDFIKIEGSRDFPLFRVCESW